MLIQSVIPLLTDSHSSYSVFNAAVKPHSYCAVFIIVF